MILSELYELFDNLRPVRRHAAGAILDKHLDGGQRDECRSVGVCREAATHLESARSILESLPGEGTQRVLAVDGRDLRLTLDYEFQELERDLLCLRGGMQAVVQALHVPGSFGDELDAVLQVVGGTRYAAVFTDRDGTIANYCGRYRSSHQPLYTAVKLGRFARERADHFFVVTSGPLYGHGLLSLSAFPEDTVHLAGSKGREYLLADGSAGSYPLTDEQRAAMITLDERLLALVEQPRYRLLSMIGSGYQRKFGQLTVSRQDIHRSVPAEVSEGFLADVHTLLDELGEQGRWFELDDTGFDIELTLLQEGEQRHGFHKGDGVGFLMSTLPESLRDAPVLVCGDTPSDVPMLEHLTRAGYETHALFVAADEDLERQVRGLASRAAFCSGPDVLVTALGIAGQSGGQS